MRQTKRASLRFCLTTKTAYPLLPSSYSKRKLAFRFERGDAAEILSFAACGKTILFRLAATRTLKKPLTTQRGATPPLDSPAVQIELRKPPLCNTQRALREVAFATANDGGIEASRLCQHRRRYEVRRRVFPAKAGRSNKRVSAIT